MDSTAIQSIVEEVLSKLGQPGQAASSASSASSASCSCKPTSGAPVVSALLSGGGSRPGVFADVAPAVDAAKTAQARLRKQGYAARREAVDIIKSLCADNAESWGKIEFDETRIGRLDHKIAKLKGIPALPGVEWLSPFGMSGDHGISLEEQAPYGTIAAISPVTHSIPTIAANAITMISAGNSVVVNAHPGGAKCAAMAVAEFNRALEKRLGIANLVTIIEQPSIESFNSLVKADGIDLICVTGGPAVVKAAMSSGKRAVCAGPGNPPVLIDETANLEQAARDIILGGAFDNNLLCIGEKQVFVVARVFDAFLGAFKKAGAVMLNDAQLARLTEATFTYKQDGGGCSHPVLNREIVGADPQLLARHAGASIPAGTEMLFAVTDAAHPFVLEEQMTPLLPVVKVSDVAEGIRLCKESEHNYRHSAMCHSRDIGVLTAMGREMDCTLFVKNGPCIAGLGIGGEGYSNFSIATTTGEGIVTPATFTRKRRCVMVDNLNIIG